MDTTFTLLSALKGQQKQMDSVANNLANVNTPGFKKDEVIFREYYNEMIGQDLESEEERFAHNEYISPYNRGSSSFVKPDHVSPAMHQGDYKSTESPFDLALHSDGFFTVDTAYGTRYTRNGQFSKSADGFLITNSGEKVQGLKGAIKVDGEVFSVGTDGKVMVDGKEVDTLKVVRFNESNRLRKVGNSMWVPSSIHQTPQKPATINIQQGALESSNVETVSEMVEMISVNRAYEAAQKAIRSNDELEEQIITIAKV